jgi:hypothetical protein
MIIICLLLLNILFINSTIYTPQYSLKSYNLKKENKTTPIYTPHKSFKTNNLKRENRTTITTINNSLFYDNIYFYYLK